MKKYGICLCALLLLGLIGGVFIAQPSLAQSTLPQGLAVLAIPAAITATMGASVTVPIIFQNGGNAIGATAFFIDFDQTCLSFDPTDANNDGQPDAISLKATLPFRSSISYNAANAARELDVLVANYSFPIASLHDLNPLLTIKFTPRCAPAANEVLLAPVRFSTETVASFGGVNGLNVAGTTQDGSVAIQAQPASTATPTVTPTPTSGAETTTPTATPVTPSATPGPGTPTVAPPTGAGTPTPPARLYLPVIEKIMP